MTGVRSFILTLMSAAFGIVGTAMLVSGTLVFLVAFFDDRPLNSWMGVSAAYALLMLGAMFILVAIVAYTANVIITALAPATKTDTQTWPEIDPARRPHWQP
jgi:hypothetical protein